MQKNRKLLSTRLCTVATIICLLLSACSTQSNSIPVSELYDSVSRSDSFEDAVVQTISVVETFNESDFLNGLIWLSDTELLIDCIRASDSSYDTLWYIADTATHGIESFYEYQSDDFSTIKNASKDDSTITIELYDGSYYEFHDGKLVTKLSGVTNSITACRDNTNNLLFYSDEERAVYNLATKEVLYQFNDISDETEPRLMQLSPDGTELVFAYTYQEATVLRTVFVDLETKETREIIKKFIMPSYFWIDNNLFVLENNEDGINAYSRICYGENFECEYRFVYDTNNKTSTDIVSVDGLSPNNIEELLQLGVDEEDLADIPGEELFDFLGERYGKQYDEGFTEQNYTLFSIGGNNQVTPLALTYKTGFQTWESTIILFSMNGPHPQTLPVYHSSNRYADFTVNPSGTLLAFREYQFDGDTDDVVILNLKHIK